MSNNKKIFIIAEIGNNHEGNYVVAKKMIKVAKLCNVDAVKLQYIHPDKFFHKSLSKSIKKYNKFYLNERKIKKLKIYSDRLGIKLFTT